MTHLPLPDARARQNIGQEKIIQRDARAISYYVNGDGPAIILHASAGREASDFNELVSDLVVAGYRTIAVEAPGIGRSGLSQEEMTLWDMADDIAAILAEEGESETALIGHAFGNRVVRAFAARFPEKAKAVIIIAAGGKRPIPEAANTALRNAFDPRRSRAKRLEDVRYAFFAGDNPVPDYWRVGWYRHTAKLQGKTKTNTDSTKWWGAGNRPMLIVQAGADRIAPKEDTADLLKEEFGDQVEIALIENAGHALLPEQPEAISEAILDYLTRITSSDKVQDHM